jgi:hypothetical protein
MHAVFDELWVKSGDATEGKPRRPASLNYQPITPVRLGGNERVGRMKTSEPNPVPAPAASVGLKPFGLQGAVEMAAAYVRPEEDAKFEAIFARVRC